MLHETLWQRNEDLVAEFLKHPFVRGLADGSLDPHAFRSYVAQDAFFLRCFVKAYALALAKCEDFAHAQTFQALIAGVLNELKLHESYATELNIHLRDVQPLAATSAYTNFLTHVAWQQSLAEIIAAMVPCLRLYAYLGQSLTASLRAEHPYRDWIEAYGGSEFRQLCEQLETLLNELGADVPAVSDAYRYALRCELDFFSAPLANPLAASG